MPNPGDFYVVRTSGWVAACIRWVTQSTVNHAGVYICAGQVVAAFPGGATCGPMPSYPAGTVQWSTDRLSADRTPSERQGGVIAAAALGMVGVKYNIPDIVAIGLAQRRFGRLARRVTRSAWVARVANTRTLICSQLVDLAYLYGGVHLFEDGRVPGLVSPGDLCALLEEL